MPSAYRYIEESYRRLLTDEELKAEYQRRRIEWRKHAIVKVAYPSRINRARALGYKAIPGYFVARVRVRKGGARKPRPRAGRRPKALGVTKYKRAKGLKQIAEERAARKYANAVVLGSYYVGEDGQYKYYEVVLVDKAVLAKRLGVSPDQIIRRLKLGYSLKVK